MALPDLPADGLNPWGSMLRTALTDISNRADQGISDASDAQDDVDDLTDVVTDNTTDITNHSTRIGTLETSNATKAADSSVVKLSGNQNITGTKTFTSAPVVPDNSFAIAKVNGLQTALNAKAPLANPTFTGTIGGIDKADVGLANVNNTTDLLKPVSTATQTALNLKADNSDLTSRIQTHNHTGGSNGVALPQSAISGLGTALSNKQNVMATASGNSTTTNSADWSFDYFHIARWGAICFFAASFRNKFAISSGASGDIANQLLGTIQTTSQFYDVYQGPSNSQWNSFKYSLSTAADGGPMTGFLDASTRQFYLAALQQSYSFPAGSQFSLAGTFLLNSDS